MSDIPKRFNFKEREERIYERWENSGLFNPDNLNLPKDAKPFTIILPPPNITDKLHLGHSMMLAIEDLLVRYHRMKGFRTLWIPGTDHAAIATQNVVEKKILAEQKKTRHDLGKEKFLEEVQKFVKETQKTILNQIKRMGSSLDWSREAFTMDEERKEAVSKMFLEMYRAGLIYRGKRIVNWCPRCHSTLADDELEYKKEKSKLYWIKYGPFVLATTRPETKLGDTAVAVHPKDKRYAEMVGKEYSIPGVLGKFKIKVVADQSVDPEFGSGAIKVTPAHSLVDNAIAGRHDLESRQIINEDGKMMNNCGKYAGLKTDEARKRIVKDMEKMGLLDHIEEDYEHNIAICYRCGEKIEPLPSKQWFVAVDKKIKELGGKSLKEKSLEVVEKEEIEFIPKRFKKRYVDWMENLHDWCISRQIWFGHEIPVWYKNEKIKLGKEKPAEEGWTKDPDTLDTWFSSGMWTFSTLGWPQNYKDQKKSGDLEKFHPTQVLETGYDILTLWVSRMIMMSLFAVKEVPFEKVYLHGLVLDRFGQKMSKSKGNGIDPIEMIEKFGTDAVRLFLLMGTTPGNDIRIFEEKIENSRNFITKIWNIFRYLKNTGNKIEIEEHIKTEDIKTLADQWIIGQVEKITQEVSQDIENYKFSQAGEKLRDFTWNDFADWYLEIHKIESNEKILGYVFGKILKLWHPLAPYVTEEIFSYFKENKFLMVSSWPMVDKSLIKDEAQKNFENLKSLIIKIRNIRTIWKIEPKKIIEGRVKKPFSNKELVEKLAGIKIKEGEGKKEEIFPISWGGEMLELDITNLIDKKQELKNIEREIENLRKIIEKNKKLLKNKKFLVDAPEKVIEETKKRLERYKEKLKDQKEMKEGLK